ncbi:MAG: bacteriochlorophyll 4-vinyl reductase [Pseudomonadota bacterium]
MEDVTVYRVGPNAIIQTIAAIKALVGTDHVTPILVRAYLREPEGGWQDMVPSGQVNALNKAVYDELGPETAMAIMRDAGRRTALYILENRIPQLVQRMLCLLPRQVACQLLLRAIVKNAWTFAGHARVEAGASWVCIHDNPLCPGQSNHAACVWHEAVFQTLFERVIGQRVGVHETRCMGRVDPHCRFEISLG